MKEYDFHPACLRMPEMVDFEYSALVKSMKDEGFDDNFPIILYHDQILDGRHRYNAANDADVEPVYKSRNDINDPFCFVRQIHEGRRHWVSQTQKAYVLMDLVEKSETYQSEQKAMLEKANDARREKAESGQVGRASKNNESLVVAHDELPLKTNKSRKLLADMLGVSQSDVDRARQIKKHGGEMADKVANGELSAGVAIKKIRTKKALVEVSEELNGNHKDVFKDVEIKIKEGKLKSAKAVKIEVQKQVCRKEGKYLPVSDAMQYADFAIAQLERINDDDPRKDEAFNKVCNWIKRRQK